MRWWGLEGFAAPVIEVELRGGHRLLGNSGCDVFSGRLQALYQQGNHTDITGRQTVSALSHIPFSRLVDVDVADDLDDDADDDPLHDDADDDLSEGGLDDSAMDDEDEDQDDIGSCDMVATLAAMTITMVTRKWQ